MLNTIKQTIQCTIQRTTQHTIQCIIKRTIHRNKHFTIHTLQCAMQSIIRRTIHHTTHYAIHFSLHTIYTHSTNTQHYHAILRNTIQYMAIWPSIYAAFGCWTLVHNLWIKAENQHWRGLDCANGGSSSSSRVHIEDSCLLLLLLAQIRSQMTNRLAVLIVQCHKKMRRVIFDLTPEAHSVTESPFFVFGVFTVFVFGIFFSKKI